MAGAPTAEIEIKLPYPSVEEARRAIRGLAAEQSSPRVLQDDWLFDRGDGELRASGRVLRLRRRPAATLTFKGPDRDGGHHKVREERELALDDPDEAEALLEGLGFERSFRYQKYRTEHRLGELEICLDETPLGCFVELEGPPGAIDAVAAKLGFSRDDYVRSSYLELYDREVRAGRRSPGHLVFEEQAEERSR